MNGISWFMSKITLRAALTDFTSIEKMELYIQVLLGITKLTINSLLYNMKLLFYNLVETSTMVHLKAK